MLNAEESGRFEKLNVALGVLAVLITIVSAVTRRGFLDTFLLVALPFWIFIGARLATYLYERPPAPWKEIPPAFAAEHPLYGVGGWAYLVVVSLSLGSLLGGSYMAAVYIHNFRASFVQAVLRSRANLPAAELSRVADLIIWSEPLTYYTLALSAMTVLSSWFVLWLLLRRSRWFRAAFVALTVTGCAAALEPNRKVVESGESDVIPCRAPESKEGARCGRLIIAARPTAAACAIPAI